MTKKEILDRVSTAFDMGLMTELNLNLMESWLDAIMRFEGGQTSHWYEFLEQEYKRLDRFSRTLANDRNGYQIIQLAAILTHPCQICATDPEAWHTRSGFCPHRKESQSIPVKTIRAPESANRSTIGNRRSQKLTEANSDSKKGWAICSECGEKEYPNANKANWGAITVHAGKCPVCGKQKTLIPRADWEGHGD